MDICISSGETRRFQGKVAWQGHRSRKMLRRNRAHMVYGEYGSRTVLRIRPTQRQLIPRFQTKSLQRGSRQFRATNRHGVYNFLFASGFATSRALSMKSCATGLSVRFFSVTMPFGTRAAGSSTGKTLISARLVGNLNAEVGIIVRKRPVASRLIRASGEMVTTVTRG